MFFFLHKTNSFNAHTKKTFYTAPSGLYSLGNGMAPFLNSRQIPFFLWKLKGEKGEVLGYKQLCIKTPRAEPCKSLCEPSGWKHMVTFTCCILIHTCMYVRQHIYQSISRFLEFLLLCLYKHAAKGACIREVGAEHSKHKSPTISWMCYFGISPHVFDSSVSLKNHLILTEMLLPALFWWISVFPFGIKLY